MLWIFCISLLFKFVSGTSLTMEDRLAELERKYDLLEKSISECTCNTGNVSTLRNETDVMPIPKSFTFPSNGSSDLVNLTCPSQSWTLFNRSCWQLFDNLNMDWPSARDFCRNLGADLASIHSEQENLLIHNVKVKDKDNILEKVTTDNTSGENITVCFKKFSNQMFIGQVEHTESHVTLDLCLSLCIATNCSSFHFYPDQLFCVTSNTAQSSSKNLTTQATRSAIVDYYERVLCYSTRSISNPCQRYFSDIMFIVDGSGSIGPYEFPKVKRFLQLIVNSTEIGQRQSRVGMVQFSDEQWIEFSMNALTSKEAVNEHIDNVPYREGGTLIGDAINFTITNELTNSTKGLRRGYPCIILVLTDGFSQDEPKEPADKLRTLNCTVFTVGVTQSVSQDQLINIAGSADRVFRVDDFDGLNKNLTTLINNQLCFEHGFWLGLNDLESEGAYQWSDGSKVDFINFADNQPNDQQHIENCIIASDMDTAQWSDIDCSTERPFVCKKDLGYAEIIVSDRQ